MSERTWGDIESEIRDDYLRADGPENIQFRDVQWQVWRAEVERAAAARALEELADDYDDIYANSDLLMQTAPKDYWRGADDAVKHATQKMRARAADIREGYE